MSIFDKLKATADTAVGNAVKQGVSNLGNKSESFTFTALPESVDQLKALPEASLDSPFKTAALTVCALCAYAADKQIGIEMLNFLKGPKPLSPFEISFLDDRFRDGNTYVPFSYFKGATPDNNYTPTEPFTVTVSSNPYSNANEGYMKLFIRSGGADNPREVVLRMKGDGRWFLWEQFLLVGIRIPKSADPWA
ncbi:MAG: hypothetical protein UE295_05730 [Acutalibacteraceae bacterium]|nr:hypothetical protein [Acutalibacteraceae bacterium]